MRIWSKHPLKGGLLAFVSMISTLLMGISAGGSTTWTCRELFSADSTDLAPKLSLKERSILMGYDRGLSRESVEALLLRLVDSGAIGGEAHIEALLRYEDVGKNVTFHNPIGFKAFVRNYTTAVYSKSDFEKLKEIYGSRPNHSNEEQRFKKVWMMASQIHGLQSSEQKIVMMWYLETLDTVLNEAIKHARRDSTRFAWKLPFFARNTAIASSLIGLSFEMASGPLGYGPLASAALPAIAAVMGIGAAFPIADRIGLGRFLAPQPPQEATKLSRDLKNSLRREATLQLSDQRTRLHAPELRSFDPRDSFEPLTLPLRAEVARVSLEADLLADLGEATQTALANLVKPLVDLAIATGKVQVRRFDQIIVELKRLNDNKSAAHKASDLNQLRTHIEKLNGDLSYTERKISQLHRLFGKSLAQSGARLTAKERGDITYFDEQLVNYSNVLTADLDSRRQLARRLLFSLQEKWL